MGIQDRDYYRQSVPSGRWSLAGWSVTYWLIAINVAVFLLNEFLGAWFDVPFVVEWGYFSAFTALYRVQVWRFMTFQFLHAGVMHLLFNMISLYFFGPVLESYLRPRRFLVFYLLCGVSGTAGYLLLWLLGWLDGATPMVGASAGIFGILMAVAWLAPTMTVIVFIVPMQLRTLAMILIGIAVYQILIAGPNMGGEAAHLGGALVGLLLIRNPHWLAPFASVSLPRFERRHRRAVSEPTDSAHVEEAELDRILDKVHKHGLASLTTKEKRTLQRASEERRRNP